MIHNKSVRIQVLSHALLASLLLGSAVAHAQQNAGNATGALSGISQPQLDYWGLRAQQNDELYIPPTVDRPLGEDAGPRLQVTGVQLDIDPTLRSQMGPELNARLNSILNNRVTENLAQGFTIGRLENLAADVTSTIRDAGFILAWAYLPEQQIQDNTVRITVLPGTLSAITADGNNRYSTTRLIGPFSDLMGSPVERTTIENSIMRVRNFPGLSTSAVFSPGADIGTSQLTLRVSEDPFDAAFVVDNHGTESTGENRFRADLFWYNPFGTGDVIAINALQTFDPAENLYGGITYETPFFSEKWTMTLAYTHNAFEVAEGLAAGAGTGGKNIAGDTDIGWIGMSRNLRLTRRSRMDIGADLAVKNAVLENIGDETEDNLTVASVFFAAEAVDNFGAGGINQLEIRYEKGLDEFLGSMSENGDGGQSTREGFSGANAGGDFDKILFRYQRLQRISRRNSLLLRAEGQFTDDILVSLEQFVIGGPNSVRAYPIAEYLADEGMFASLEWTVELTNGGSNSFSISAFGDYAYGKINDPFPNEIDDTDLGGYGVGLSYRRLGDGGNQLSLRVNVATPATDLDPSDGDDPQVYGQISYTFR